MSSDGNDLKTHVPHHVSDVDTWGGPDRNYYVFVALSFLGGFMGLDHFYLRSFGTGTQKFLMNLCSFGFWYFWDCAQILQEGQKIRKEGLSSPFDWIRGIGRGVFLEGRAATAATTATTAAGGGGVATAEKSYVTYTILAVFLGFLGANQFYLGNWGQGFAKMFSCFNIFLFLFGWLWVAWDAFHAFFMTNTVLQEGVTPPLPYSIVFEPTDSSVFRVGGGGSTTSGSEGGSKWLDWLPLPPVPDFSFLSQMVKTLLPLAVTPPVVKAIKELKTPTLTPYSPLSGLPAPSSLIPNAPLPEPPVLMRGGGGGSEGGAGPIVAGVLTAVVLAGGLKGTYDFITKQYG